MPCSGENFIPIESAKWIAMAQRTPATAPARPSSSGHNHQAVRLAEIGVKESCRYRGTWMRTMPP